MDGPPPVNYGEGQDLNEPIAERGRMSTAGHGAGAGTDGIPLP